MRKPFIAGNWKMNMDSASAVSLADGVAAGSDGIAGESVDVAIVKETSRLNQAKATGVRT